MSKPIFSRPLARLAAFFAALLVLGAAAPAALAAIPDRPENQYVLDSAGVLSQDLEEEIIEENQRLFESCGAEVAVAAVDFFGGQDREDYANRLFNRWGIGSSERNNGILLVLAIGEEDYYATAGSGIEDYFDGAKLDDLLYDYLEPDFAREDYDAGVKKFFRAVVDELDSYYAHTPAGNGAGNDSYGGNDSDWDHVDLYDAGYAVSRIVFAILRVVVVVVILLVVFSLIKRAGRGGRGPGPGSGGGGGGGFWQGMYIGSALNRRRHRPYWGAPPPPPPPGGFGGFGGPGPRPPRPPRGGGMGGFGGFSSGGRSGGFGGAGRGSRGGGGGVHSGGSSRGGGAGRRR